MRTTVVLDDDLLRTAQDYSGKKDTTALLRLALKALIHLRLTKAQSQRRINQQSGGSV